MKFEISNDQEANQKTTSRLKEGPAQFRVIEAREGLSKTSGLSRIELKLEVNDIDGGKGIIYDYLSASPKSTWKIKQFLIAIGQHYKYKSGEISSYDCLNQTGRCELIMEESNNPQYEPQMKVKEYCSPKPESEEFVEMYLNDDIPF